MNLRDKLDVACRAASIFMGALAVIEIFRGEIQAATFCAAFAAWVKP